MKNGPYILVVAPTDYPGKKYRERYCYQHHLVWWQNGRKLPKKNLEVIHHKNHDKTDNRIDNLELKQIDLHNKEHKEISTANAKCAYCKKEFRVRPFKLKRPYNFCSRVCIGKFNFKKKIISH